MAGARRGLASAATHTRWLLGALTTALVALLLVAGAHAKATATQVTLEVLAAGGAVDVTYADPENEEEAQHTDRCEDQFTLCEFRYLAPERLILTAQETDSAIKFHGWTAAECPPVTPSAAPNQCEITLREDELRVSVIAIYDPSPVSIAVAGNGTVTWPPGPDNVGTCSDSCVVQLPVGVPITFTAHPLNQGDPVRWLFGGCEPNPSVPLECVGRAENRILGAVFGDASEPNRPFEVDVTLRVRSVGSGSGKVAGEGLDCGTGQACSTPVAYGKLVTLQAVADAGSHFDGWEGGVCGNSAACRFNAGPVTSVRARFLPGGASQPPPQPPPTQPPPTQPPPTQPPPPTTRLAVRIVGASAVRVNGRWRVAARVVANQPVRVRGRVGRGRATWADRTFRLPRGTTLVRFQLSRKARAGVCWLRLVATNADGEIRNPQRSVKLGR